MMILSIYILECTERKKINMGKIRIKKLEESSPEEEAKLRAKKEAKKAEKMAKKTLVKSAGLAEEPDVIEETVKPVIASEDSETVIASDSEAISTHKADVKQASADAESSSETKKKTKKEKFIKVRTTSKRHKENEVLVSKSTLYPTDKAIETLKKFKVGKFDETVELHVNVKEKGVSGQVVLPHGTGKTLRIVVADEAILAEVEKGKINFDVLVATPSMMPQLAKVARVLGPRGLMPNPKNGTITDKPEEAIKKLSAGQVSFKTESAAPIIHVSIGKLSFEDKKLNDNMKAMLTAIGEANIKSAILKSTMSPAIRLESLSVR